MIMYAQVIAGFVLLLGGAEVMVRGAVALAQRLGISTLVIGMTVVAFGTSAPELVVSLNAGLSGAPGLAIGNVVGSNIANILLILGISGLIAPIACQAGSLVRDGLVLLGGSLLFAGLALSGRIGLTGGIVLLIAFFGFIAYSAGQEIASKRSARDAEIEEEVEDLAVPHNLLLSLVLLVVGFAGLLLGSEWLVDGGISIARNFGVSEAVIGLTIIAFGTSLPELAASAVATYRGHTDVALGNVVGSNLFNLLGVVGTVAVVTPLDIPGRVLDLDLWIMLAATLLLLPFMLSAKKYLGRIESGIFFLLYLAYIAALALGIDRLPGI